MVPSYERIKLVAEAGYLCLFPLVRNYTAMYFEAIDPASPAYVGGFGRWARLRLADSYEWDAKTSHAFSLQERAWLDVRTEPLIVATRTPVAGCTTRVIDLWGFVAAAHVADGAEDWSVMIVPPEWSGSIPVGAGTVVRGESPFLRYETWSRSTDPREAASVEAASLEHRIEPLSIWAGGEPAASLPPIGWVPVTTDLETSLGFWNAASFALTLVTPHADDAVVLEQLGDIGVVAGHPWDAANVEPDVLEAIAEGTDEAITRLLHSARTALAPAPPSRPLTEGDYLDRAVAALVTEPGLAVHDQRSSPA